MFDLKPADVESALRGVDPADVPDLLADALALARRHAPCLGSPDFNDPDAAAAATAIIRGALRRHAASDGGALQSWQAGPFGATAGPSGSRGSMFNRVEVDMLKSLCRQGVTGGAFAISTIPPGAGS